MGTAGRGEGRHRRGIREIGLPVVGEGGAPAQLGEDRIEVEQGLPRRRLAVVLREQAIDVDATGTDRRPAAGERNLESARDVPGDGRPAHRVDRLRAMTPFEDLDQLVPVRVELDAALLGEDAAVVIRRSESLPAVVATHGLLSLDQVA